ncbi:MAG: hypothetical protein GWP08_14505 [Nitrospiraceae bacterium]|nr:hypothetical protein [Nitrospiraceae bacterium]
MMRGLNAIGADRLGAGRRLVWVLCATCVFSGASLAAETLVGQVVAVPDGDTLHIEQDGQVTVIRLQAVDCPELAQAYGPEAAAFTSGLVLNRPVTATLMPAPESEPVKTEGYLAEARQPGYAGEPGIRAAVVTLADGTDVNYAVLDAGMAWLYERDPLPDRTYRRVAARAIVEKTGLWADPAPLAPWDYRRDAGEGLLGVMRRFTLPSAPETKLEAKAEPEAGKTLSLKGDGPLPPRTFFPKYANDPIYRQLKPRWYMGANGQVAGIVADGLAGNPMAAMLGFQDGDVIQSVNGMAIRSEGDVERMIGQLKGAQSMGIVRNGQPDTITIPIAGLLR